MNECYCHRLLPVAQEKNIVRGCFLSEDRWAALANHTLALNLRFSLNVERMVLQRGAIFEFAAH